MPELEDEEDSDHENWTQLETNCASYIQRCIYFVYTHVEKVSLFVFKYWNVVYFNL
jgi:hypothetical protein